MAMWVKNTGYPKKNFGPLVGVKVPCGGTQKIDGYVVAVKVKKNIKILWSPVGLSF